jgi:hypothetical protein
MKKIITIFSLLSLLLNGLTNAQTWQPLLGVLDWDGRDLYADMVSGKLFVGGNIYDVNGHNDFGLAAWDGASCVGENKIKESNDISISPNPASNEITIHQSSPQINQQLIISDITGRETLSQIINQQSSISPNSPTAFISTR